MMMRKRQSEGLAVSWTKNTKTPEEKKNLEDAIRNSTTALGRLQELLDDKMEDLFLESLKEKEYDNPAWVHKQAYSNGYAAGIKHVVDLLSFLPRK